MPSHDIDDCRTQWEQYTRNSGEPPSMRPVADTSYDLLGSLQNSPEVETRSPIVYTVLPDLDYQCLAYSGCAL